jgi:hypothetical protein
MNTRLGEALIVGAGLAYLGILGWAMGNLSYDIWGALIVGPIYGIVGYAVIRSLFRGSLHPIAVVLSWGMLIKLGGVAGRYWVGFEAYEGGIDAGRYHDYGIFAAGRVWAGEVNVFYVVPRDIGTTFVDQFTALTYTLTGGSQLAGFVTFAFLAYLGTIFIVKAAVIAIPSLAAKRYAWMCVLFPSIVYWPSSVGKEALMMLGLGVATYGIANLLTNGRWLTSGAAIGFGVLFAAVVRPHIAGIWIAAALPALVVAVLRPGSAADPSRSGPRVSRIGLVAVLTIAAVAFFFIAAFSIKFLEPFSVDPSTGTTDSLTRILDETARRTSQAGSNFAPPSISSPKDWPFAVVRTLTRPLPFEATGIAQLISAAEMAVLIGIYALSWKRLRNLPKLIVTNPYVMFVVVAIALTGLAYASLANLGVLARQKSLIIPFMVLLPCLPMRKPRELSGTKHEMTHDARTNAPELSPHAAL